MRVSLVVFQEGTITRDVIAIEVEGTRISVAELRDALTSSFHLKAAQIPHIYKAGDSSGK